MPDLPAALLLATLLASASAQQVGGTAESRPPASAEAPGATAFLRFVREGDGGHLDAAITRYQDPQGRAVTLFAAIHIADGEHFEALQRRFTACDALLYELVAEPGAVPERSGADGSLVPVLQSTLRSGLELEFQLDAVDYTAPNFVHADMTPGEFTAALTARGETLLDSMLRQSRTPARGSDGQGTPFDLLDAFRGGDRRQRLRVRLATDLETLEVGATAAGSALIEGRNETCLAVLARQLAQGRRELGIYFGAAHLPHLERRLTALGFERRGQEWLPAWDCTLRAEGRREQQEWLQRRRARSELAALEQAARQALREQPDALPRVDRLAALDAAGRRRYAGGVADPWGHAYVLHGSPVDEPGGLYLVDVQSLGPDGIDGTADDLHTQPRRERVRALRLAQQIASARVPAGDPHAQAERDASVLPAVPPLTPAK